MKKIDHPVKNPDLLRSLAYTLEREFPGASFRLSGKDGAFFVEYASTSTRQVDGFEVEAFSKNFLDKSARMANRVSAQTIFYHRPERTQAPLPTAGIVQSDLPGISWLGSEVTNLVSLLDYLFLTFARSEGACEISPSSLISRKNLERTGYLPKEAHQIGSVFTERDGIGHSTACLCPAACLTTYPALENQVLAQDASAFTFRSNVYRYEAGVFSKHFPLERLWEFQVRELIFFGDKTRRDAVQENYFNLLRKIAATLDLPVELSTATDTFFHSEYSSRALHQLMERTKYEINFLYTVDSEDCRLALSSFNLHGQQFTNEFNISGVNKDTDYQSFCIGFGLHRWAQALLISGPSFEILTERLRGMI